MFRKTLAIFGLVALTGCTVVPATHTTYIEPAPRYRVVREPVYVYRPAPVYRPYYYHRHYYHCGRYYC